MRTCKITDITILPNRQRQEFTPDALQELVDSIEAHGLMHPPVLREQGGKLILVAGERRLKAMQQIFELGGKLKHDNGEFLDGWIPYSTLGDLDELEAEEAELDENLKRKDLTWQELANAHSRLHKLRQKQNPPTECEVKTDTGSTVIKHPGQTVADTAKEIFGRSDGDFQDVIRKELIVAKHLDNPAIAKAKDVKEAFKILKKEEERSKNLELAKEVGATMSLDKHTIENVDCIDWMKAYIGPKFDVIVTDPPYGMGADQFGDAGGKLSGIEHHYDDSYESWVKLMNAWAPLSYAVTAPQAHAYVFCDFDRFHELKNIMETYGWEVFRTPLIVHKRNSGRVPLPERGPRRQYELVLFANKGRMPCTNIYPDVISVDADENTGHGAQKPVALYQNLLQRSVRPGMRVADFFAGSGPMLEAAQNMHCYATLTEQSPEYYGKILKRAADLRKLESGNLLEGL